MYTKKQGTAVYTIVNNDMTILELWLKYYTKYFDYVYVIGNGTKEEYGELEELKEDYDFDFERIEYQGGIQELLGIVSEKQVELLKDYKWVLYCNCDEFLITDGKRYKDIKDLMDRTWKKYIGCEAYEVYQDTEGGEKPIDYDKPYFKQRKYWFRNVAMNKILLTRYPLEWELGHHRLKHMSPEESRQIEGTGLYLVHLKYSDLEADPKERDFGPYERGLQLDLVEKGKRIRQRIPAVVRNAV